MDSFRVINKILTVVLTVTTTPTQKPNRDRYLDCPFIFEK